MARPNQPSHLGPRCRQPRIPSTGLSGRATPVVCMDAGTSLARQARTKHRHELRTLTYVTLDQANGGIVRNLTREGIGVQAVAAVHPLQEVRIRFELRHPKLRVEARGQVMWSTFSGQCGIRFIELSPT